MFQYQGRHVYVESLDLVTFSFDIAHEVPSHKFQG